MMSRAVLDYEISKHVRSGEHSSIVALWRGVIAQALMDIRQNHKATCMQPVKFQARAWLRGGSKDFEQVCQLAELDPAYVRRKVEEMLKQADPAEAAEQRMTTHRVRHHRT